MSRRPPGAFPCGIAAVLALFASRSEAEDIGPGAPRAWEATTATSAPPLPDPVSEEKDHPAGVPPLGEAQDEGEGEVEPDDEVIQAGGGAPSPSSGLSRAVETFRISGYVDIGLSRAENKGRGFIFDTSGRFAERFPRTAWILLGDPLSTPVNARGEPADTTGSFAFKHDPVNSEGALSFMVNEVNVDLSSSPIPSVLVFASIDFLPRTGVRGTLGDFFEVDYAFVDYTPFDALDLTFSVGKFDSAFGREYRVQESIDRFGVTPSLLFRYVGGHPIGLKARTKLLDGDLIVNLAVANGSSFVELMELADEVDRNDMKTGSGRISYRLKLLGATLEVGVSGEIGAEARQTDNDVLHHQVGGDLALDVGPFSLVAEVVDGNAEGGGIDDADALDYTAFYVLATYRILSGWGVFGRFERRDATHSQGDLFVYLIDIERLTAGTRIDLSQALILKLEYLWNRERDPLPSFGNNVVVASFVAGF